MKRVLILDEDPDILQLLKRILEMHGYTTEIISNGQLLQASIEKYLPNLILMDITLPGTSGLELSRRLKEDEKTKDIPVVLFSDNIDMIKKAGEYGAADHISKPFSVKDLLRTIGRNINK